MLRLFNWKKMPNVRVPFAIRVSARAKYIHLRILPGTGLEVVLPKGCPKSKVKEVLWAERGWIAEHREQIEEAARQGPRREILPDVIEFLCIDRRFTVTYEPQKTETPSLYMPDADTVTVQADPGTEAEICCQLLQSWLKNRARQVLVPLVWGLSTVHNLPIAKVQVRLQKTRLGSLSTSGTLSLNSQLMFFPPELVQHILLHELCHIRHPNHGPGFKALLSSLSDHSTRYEREMKSRYRELVPFWARM